MLRWVEELGAHWVNNAGFYHRSAISPKYSKKIMLPFLLHEVTKIINNISYLKYCNIRFSDNILTQAFYIGLLKRQGLGSILWSKKCKKHKTVKTGTPCTCKALTTENVCLL